MGTWGQPNWDGWLSSIWGWPVEYGGALPLIANASNIVYGTNPPYTVNDFVAFFPAFGGTPVPQQATTVNGENTITVLDVTNLGLGNLVAGPGILLGTFITGISGTTLTLSNAATASAGPVTIQIYNAPAVPFVVMTAYIYLATSSLVQARWQEMWATAMNLFVAHYLVLYAKAAGKPNATTSQIAAAGLATGIVVAKSANDVSVSFSPVQGIEDWGSFNLSIWGQQLATLAAVIGSGPVVVY